MWNGEFAPQGLGATAATVHLAAEAVDDFLSLGKVRARGKTIELALLASGSFGGPAEEACSWRLGPPADQDGAWQALDWTFAPPYGSKRTLACLLRVRPYAPRAGTAADANADGAPLLAIEVIFPSEASAYAPRPLAPQRTTKAALAALRASGRLLRLERCSVAEPGDNTLEDAQGFGCARRWWCRPPTELKLGTSLYRAVRGLFKVRKPQIYSF